MLHHKPTTKTRQKHNKHNKPNTQQQKTKQTILNRRIIDDDGIGRIPYRYLLSDSTQEIAKSSGIITTTTPAQLIVYHTEKTTKMRQFVISVLAGLIAFDFLSFSIVNAADLSGFWHSKDLEAVQKKCQNIAINSLSSKDIYYSLQLLGRFIPTVNAYCSCNHILENKNQDSVLALYYSLRSNDICGCGGYKNPLNDFKRLAETSLAVSSSEVEISFSNLPCNLFVFCFIFFQ